MQLAQMQASLAETALQLAEMQAAASRVKPAEQSRRRESSLPSKSNSDASLQSGHAKHIVQESPQQKIILCSKAYSDFEGSAILCLTAEDLPNQDSH